MTGVDPDRAHTLGAFLCCDHDQGIAYEAVMEAHGPQVVNRVIAEQLDAGRIVESIPGEIQIVHAVLDVLDDQEEVVRDYLIPNEYAWDWWRKTIELRATSSDCRICEPEAYVRVYGAAGVIA